MTATKTTKRNPWPYAIVSFLACFLMFSIGLVAFASHQRMDLVKGDYYDEEIRYQEQLNRMNHTTPVNAEISIKYEAAMNAIAVTLPQSQDLGKATGYIRLYRPSDESMDKEVTLAVTAKGVQDLDADALKPGLWRVRVYWTASGTDYFYSGDVVIPAPKKS